jgi:PPOX class probable F420-dependent enzyme
MDSESMRRRVAAASVARLATIGRDGRPRARPVCFALVGDNVVTAVDDVKPKSSGRLARLDDIAANPWAEVLVDHYSDDWSELWWVRISGRAEVLALDGAEDAVLALKAKYRQYAAQPPPGPVIRVQGERWSGWSAAGSAGCTD